MEREKVTGEIEISSDLLSEIKKIKNIFELKTKIEKYLEASTTNLLSVILAGAVQLNVSDIHIEPEETKAKIRMRIDGVLQDTITLELKIYKHLISRIKVLSKLKLNISNRPQDGRFTISMENTIIEIRCSTLPAEYGEAVVMRTLNPNNLIKVEALGLRKDLAEIFDKEMRRPNGMIIVTGPTGSGKTTTLYAVLKTINSPDIKIITIEDPVEYHLEGLSQTQVDPSRGYTFANGLRALMRQDPDVILVGEIRDLETAEIACQAALTGHLVFSTLHTNDAAGAIARLIDLGVRPVTIAPALNMIIAQRLPRKVCKECVQFVSPSKQELEKIKKGLEKVKKEILPPAFFETEFKIPKTVGCQNCNLTGYKGRIGIYEFFLVDDEMQKFILTSPSIVDIRNLAIKKGMILMYQDGLIKVLEGITSLEEIERITGGFEFYS